MTLDTGSGRPLSLELRVIQTVYGPQTRARLGPVYCGVTLNVARPDMNNYAT